MERLYKPKSDQICVLVVEDDSMQRLGLLDLLATLDYKCKIFISS